MKKIHILFMVLCAIQFCGLNLKASTDEENLKNIIKNTVENIKQNDGSIVIESSTKETYYSSTPDTSKLTSQILGKRAAVQGYMSNMRVSAELYYSNKNSYGPTTNSCSKGMFSDKLLSELVSSVKTNGGTQLSCSVVSNSKASVDPSWMMTAKLPGGNFWCVDSQGASQYVGRGYKNGDKRCESIPSVLTKKKMTDFENNNITIFPKDSSFIVKLDGNKDESTGLFMQSNGYIYITIPTIEKIKPELKGSLLKIKDSSMNQYKIIDFDRHFALVLQSDKFKVVKKKDSLYQASIPYIDYLNLFSAGGSVPMVSPIGTSKDKKLVFDIHIENNLVKKIVSRNISISTSDKYRGKTSGVATYNIKINTSSNNFPTTILSSTKILSCEEYLKDTEYLTMCEALK